MTRSADPDAEPVSGLWAYGAAALLALDGLSTLLYGGLLREPLFDTSVELPFGRMALIWVVLAGILFAAAVGVAGHKSWGRYLGIATQFVSIGVGLMVASQSVALPDRVDRPRRHRLRAMAPLARPGRGALGRADLRERSASRGSASTRRWDPHSARSGR